MCHQRSAQCVINSHDGDSVKTEGFSSTTIDGVVGAALHGMRIDRAVAITADVSRSQALQLIRNRAVTIDGVAVISNSKRISKNQRLVIAVFDNETQSAPLADDTVEFAVVYCDEDVAVINKPAGLVVHPGVGNLYGTLVNGLLACYPWIADVGETSRPGIVHRLDRDTSGLLMVALNAHAYDSLTAQLRTREPERSYFALVWGHLDDDAGMVDAPVGRSNRNPTRMVVTERGKSAITCYEVHERFVQPDVVSLLSCQLKTGRTHQIRVHLQAIGHPVVGDIVYRGQSSGTFRIKRPFLHAKSLAFSHPSTGKTMRFTCDLPDELAAVLTACTAIQGSDEWS